MFQKEIVLKNKRYITMLWHNLPQESRIIMRDKDKYKTKMSDNVYKFSGLRYCLEILYLNENNLCITG